MARDTRVRRSRSIINFGVPFAVSAQDGPATVHDGSFLARLSAQPATGTYGP